MATIDIAPREAESGQGQKRIVNDFSVQVATVNGSGSQTANTVLLRTIFQMGVPVSGKNLFPSNIAGLPTWYTIRASKDGYIARKKEIDFLIAMNPETAHEDVMSLTPGAAVLYDEPLALNKLRPDLTFYTVPYDKLVGAVCPDAKLRKLVKNMLYVGVTAKILDLDMNEVEKALRKQFKKKQRAFDLNWGAAKAGFDYAAANLTKQDPYFVERMDKTAGKIIIDGNAAAALGSVFAGCTVVTWYPITPSSSLVETMIEYMKRFRIKDGKATFAIVQAEDELAAIGMVIGAAWAGARSMTSTAGPGISLMSEFIGLAYYAEIPAVVWDVQRVGPSTGLPTRTAQGDVLMCATLSHGDTGHILLFPSSVSEAFDFAGTAFDLAEHFQTPVFVLSDLDLGMNNWMSDPFKYPEAAQNRGKVLSKEDLERLKGEWGRYQDVDGDGIGYRTLPGTDHPNAAYFTRGSGHNARAQYSERPDDYKNNMDRLRRKLETARGFVPKPEQIGSDNKVGMIAYGTSHWGCTESRDQLKKEYGVDVDYHRVRGYPFSQETIDFIDKHERVYVVDQNRDGQLLQLLKLELSATRIAKLRSVRHYNGLPLDARSVTDEIITQEGK